MLLFEYKAVNELGEEIKNSQEAISRDLLIEMIKNKGYYPIYIKQVKRSKKKLKDIQLFSCVKLKDISIFCRQLYTLLNAGVGIVLSLDILSMQMENKRFRFVVGRVKEEVEKGSALSEAMNKYKKDFPNLLINMIETGELSGTLDNIMGKMAIHYEKENKINNKIKVSMMYPAILAVVSFCIVVFLLVFVMPNFVDIFESSGVKLPLLTRILLFISSIIINRWYIIILIVFVGIYIIGKMIKEMDSKMLFDSMKLKIPIVKNLHQKIITSRFTRALAILLSSGIPLVQSLDIVSRVVGNRVVECRIKESIEDVKAGVALAIPIKKMGVFPPVLCNMIKVGEESGALDEILDKTSVFYDDELENALEKMVALIEPLMIIILALIVGFIVFAMIIPIFDMMQLVN